MQEGEAWDLGGAGDEEVLLSEVGPTFASRSQ